jgi:hypothetical protein
MGVIFGHEAFVQAGQSDFHSRSLVKTLDKAGSNRDDILRGKALNVTGLLHLPRLRDGARGSAQGRAAFKHLKSTFFRSIQGRVESRTDANIYASWIRRWWQPWAPRTD